MARVRNTLDALPVTKLPVQHCQKELKALSPTSGLVSSFAQPLNSWSEGLSSLYAGSPMTAPVEFQNINIKLLHYYIRLMVFFQDNLGNPVPER